MRGLGSGGQPDAGDTTPRPPSRLLPRRYRFIGLVVAAVFVVVVLVLFATHPWTSTYTPPPVYAMEGTSIAFTGNAASDFEVFAPNTCMHGTCGTGMAGSSIFVPVAVGITNFGGSCSTPQYEVTQVSSLPTGEFVITQVQGVPGYAPTNLGNGSCQWVVYMGVTVQIVPQGPAVQTLYLTVSVDIYT